MKILRNALESETASENSGVKLKSHHALNLKIKNGFELISKVLFIGKKLYITFKIMKI